MELNIDILWLTLAMAACLYGERALPLLLLSGRNLPPIVLRWLEFVPAAVFAAILSPSVFLVQQADGSSNLDFTLSNPFFWATFPAFILAFKNSFFGTVAVGMIGVAAIRYFTN